MSTTTLKIDDMMNYDTGFLTAYRSEYTIEQNRQRNLSLLAKLQDMRYQVFSIEGVYLESYRSPDQKEAREDIFCIVDLNDAGKLQYDLEALGRAFDQDSILFIPKGDEKGLLIGTSSRENIWPGSGKVLTLQNLFGRDGEVLTHKDSPFKFGSSSRTRERKLPEGFMARLACNRIARLAWWDIPL